MRVERDGGAEGGGQKGVMHSTRPQRMKLNCRGRPLSDKNVELAVDESRGGTADR